MHKLTATEVKKAESNSKPWKLADGGGLYLLINPNGTRYWRYDYRYAGKRKTFALGVFPEISLKGARDKHREARSLLDQGVDPSQERKSVKLTCHSSAANTFEAIGREWFEVKMLDKSEGHQRRTKSTLEKDLYPYVGSQPITSVTAPELLAALRRIESRDAVDMAHQAKRIAGKVFRYAIVTGRAQRDPSSDLNGALKETMRSHFSAIVDPVGVGKLMTAIDSYHGSPVVRAALKISPLLFQRPGEIRAMEWAEINWDENRWEIPAAKMKMRLQHIVPLSTQAIDLLHELHPLTGRGKYVFPSLRGAHRCLSDNTVRIALRILGYDKETMTAHGFRAMARTILDEVLGYRVDWIEHQLAHAVKDPNGRAYNRTAHLEAWRDAQR
jgi:integrase